MRSSSMGLDLPNIEPPTQNVLEESKEKARESRKQKELEKPTETTKQKRRMNVNGKQKEPAKDPEISEQIFILEPNSFDVLLLVDTQETNG